MSYLRCSSCGRSLKFAYAGKGYRIFGPTCAAKLGVKPAASPDLPPRLLPPPRKVRRVRRARPALRRAVTQWGQLLLDF